ncbi:MAG: tRNA (guanosine(37)-N1)-methyltransferase TrmD [Candidatus Glassbacteria bacterium]
MNIFVITLFPELFDGFTRGGAVKRAIKQEAVKMHFLNPRDFTEDKHRQVDDYPFGGGAGMVLKPEPIFRAVESIWDRTGGRKEGDRVVLLTAKGEVFNHEKAVEFSVAERLILISGHYKDVDERVRSGLVTDEVSLGDFILSGGEIVAMAIIDSVVRLLPGVLGDFESALGDSFFDGLLSPPAYTRPNEYRDMKVPDILLSGDHEAIREWRRKEALRLTQKRRPDLWEKYRSSWGIDEDESEKSI